MLMAITLESSWRATDDGAPRIRHVITCIPSDAMFKLPRFEKPKIAGIQTATVVGDTEIDVDEDGRVELQFHWDRRNTNAAGASRRVRVSQAWAGVGYGLVTLPRVGDEVVVAFLDGDPDEPLIVGRVHNHVRPSPLTRVRRAAGASTEASAVDAQNSLGGVGGPTISTVGRNVSMPPEVGSMMKRLATLAAAPMRSGTTVTPELRSS